MKKKSLLVTIHLLLLTVFAFSLTACDNIGGKSTNFDNKNITQVENQEGYYTDSNLAFCAEIRGSYKSNRPFTLDAQNENLRVWDNIYLYEYDYFQMIASGSGDIFYSVNSEDLEYVDIDDRFAQATVKADKSGIYKITFDLSTKIFDLQFKSEITTPIYEKMEGCDVYSLKSEFTPLTQNPNNSEELMISNYSIESGALISFYNHGKVHLSNYKVILDSAIQGKYATALEDGDKHVTFAVGGVYNLYVNPTTYVVRVELTNPDTANYTLQVYKASDDIITLTPEDPSVPYIFNYTITVRERQSLPIFVSAGFTMYDLALNPSEYVNSEYEKFITAGTYRLEINLKTFTVTANYIPQ